MKYRKLRFLALIAGTFAAESARAYQAKSVSGLYVSGSVPMPVCSGGTLAVIASVPLPTKYNSKKDYLTITTNVESYCPGDQLFAAIRIAGNVIHPTSYAKQCDGSFGASTTSLWWVFPESQGGPVIPDDATVDLGICDNAGGATLQAAQVRVEVQK
jgi:hypothetical protein